MFTVIFKKQSQSKSFHNQLVKARLYFVAHYLKLPHNQFPAIWRRDPTRPDSSKENKIVTYRPDPTQPNPTQAMDGPNPCPTLCSRFTPITGAQNTLP